MALTTSDPTPPGTAPEGARQRYGTGWGGIAPRVFWPGLGIILTVALVAVIFPEQSERAVGALQENVIGAFGWYYVLLVAAFVAFSLWVGLSRFGDIVLGKDDDEPQFSVGAWFSMLFAAGMGIGLVFWGVAE